MDASAARSERMSIRIASACGIAMASVGFLVLVGWQWEIEALKSIIPGFIAMNPLTAILFICAGAWLVAASRGARRFALVFACIVTAGGLFKLLSFAGLDAHVDQLLYARQLLLYTPPNTMAPNTALDFFLIGVAMLFHASRASKRMLVAHALTILAGTFAFLALVGYAYGANFLYTVRPFIGMALHTAVLFLIFLCGMLLLTPRQGVMRLLGDPGSGGVLSRRLFSIGLAAPFFFGLAEVLGVRFGYYSPQSGTAFVAVGLAVAFGAFVWRGATEIQRTEEKLAEIRAMESQLIEHLPVGVFMVEAGTGKVVVVNPRSTQLLGRGLIPEAEATSLSALYDILKEDGTPYPSEELPVNVVLREGREVVKDDLVARKPGGEKINLHVIGVPVNDSNGRLRFAIAVFDDITKEKEVDRAKTEFVSIASHQLRTPLTSINWYSEMLISSDAPKEPGQLKEYLAKIHAGSQRMVALVDALLNVSRIELGTLIVDPKPTDVDALIADVVNEQMPQALQHGVIISTDVPEDLPVVMTDPEMLRMVFQNLLSNAIKYTPPEGSIRVGASREGTILRVTVADTGYGIPKKDQDKIFEKMYRADNIKEKGEAGTGLGLYIVKSVLETLGGAVRFESEENKGTTFFVTIPV